MGASLYLFFSCYFSLSKYQACSYILFYCVARKLVGLRLFFLSIDKIRLLVYMGEEG